MDEEDPFDRLQRRMERLEKRIAEMIEETFTPPWDLGEKALEPLYDIEEFKDGVVVTADLPFVRDRKDLEVNCTENSVEIKATMCKPVSFRRWGTVQRDTDFYCYRKVIPLPFEVDPDKATARFKDGILEVRIPKKSQRQKIRVL